VERRWLVTAALMAALLAACGGGSGPPRPEPIRIGALVPVSTLGVSYYVSAFRAAERDINAHGGIRGRPIAVEVCDDRSDPNEAQVCARRLVGHGVVATTANISEFSMVESPILDEAGIAQVGSEALNPEDFNLPTAFPLDGGIFVQLAGGVVGMQRRGLHSMFVVTLDTPPGRTLVQSTGLLARAGGIGLAGAAYIPAAASDLTSYVQAAIQSKAEVVVPGLPPLLTIPFLMASRRAGARFLIMVPAGELTPADIARMGGPASITENDVEFSALPPLSASDRFPALREFQADMDAQLAAGDRSAAPEHRNGGSVSAWLSIQIVARVAATLTTVDAASVLNALRTSPTIDTLGLTPPWSPGRTLMPNMPRITNLYGYLSTQRSGVLVLTDPAPFNPLLVLRLAG
jgi:ABC-type branched-subunit amino acid transport system substrate-binding protein